MALLVVAVAVVGRGPHAAGKQVSVSPPASAPVAQPPSSPPPSPAHSGQTSAAATPSRSVTAASSTASTSSPLSVVVPACGGAQLCRVPGTNVYAEPGTIYDPATGRTRAIPALPAGYRAYLCRVEHVQCS